MSPDDPRATIPGRSGLSVSAPSLEVSETLAKLSGRAAETSESTVPTESTLVCLGRGVAGAEKGLDIVKFIPGIFIPVLDVGDTIPGVAVDIVEADNASGEFRSNRTPRATLSVLASAVVGDRAFGASEDRSIVSGLDVGFIPDSTRGEGSADGGAGTCSTGGASSLMAFGGFGCGVNLAETTWTGDMGTACLFGKPGSDDCKAQGAAPARLSTELSLRALEASFAVDTRYGSSTAGRAGGKGNRGPKLLAAACTECTDLRISLFIVVADKGSSPIGVMIVLAFFFNGRVATG